MQQHGSQWIRELELPELFVKLLLTLLSALIADPQ